MRLLSEQLLIMLSNSRFTVSTEPAMSFVKKHVYLRQRRALHMATARPGEIQ